MLREENTRLKHPGISSLATIFKYPIQSKAILVDEEKIKKRRSFTYANLLTSEEAKMIIEKVSNAIEEDKRKKEDKRAIWLAKKKANDEKKSIQLAKKIAKETLVKLFAKKRTLRGVKNTYH